MKIFSEKNITVTEQYHNKKECKIFVVSNGELSVTLDYCPVLVYENLQNEIFERFLIKNESENDNEEREKREDEFWLNEIL